MALTSQLLCLFKLATDNLQEKAPYVTAKLTLTRNVDNEVEQALYRLETTVIGFVIMATTHDKGRFNELALLSLQIRTGHGT